MNPIKTWSSQEDVYVLDIVHNHSGYIGGLLSNGKFRVIPDLNAIDFVDVNLLGNRAKRITGVANGGPNDVIWASSSEGIVSAWDLKTKSSTPVATCTMENTNFSCVDVGLNGMLIACGTEQELESRVLFWDVRNTRVPLGVYEESHSDSITNVRFAPDGSPAFLSGSVDGLVCAFDISQPSETSALRSVLNAGSACSRLGFFGTAFDGIYVTTTTETLCIFEAGSCSRIGAYENDLVRGTGCRETLQSLAQIEVNYLVDCLWEPKTQKLLLLAGNSGGMGFGFEVTLAGFIPLGPLAGGHSDIIRSTLLLDLGAQHGFGILTGGEDARICLFTPG